MPVYLVFLQVAKKNFQLALRGAWSKLGPRGPSPEENFFRYVSYQLVDTQNRVSTNFLKFSYIKPETEFWLLKTEFWLLKTEFWF
jgi:hypothetical protein